MRIADAIFERLSREVDTVFYLAGGGASHLVDALGNSGMRAVACLHEQGAGYAAVSYAMYKGFGVCLTTSGPGASNAMTPCLAAWVDSIPVLFISGQVMTKWLMFEGMRCRGTQEAPVVEMVHPITKFVAQTRKGNTMQMLENCIKKAKEGRQGPTWLDVPQDIQNEQL